jgi:hypothetical protein
LNIEIRKTSVLALESGEIRAATDVPAERSTTICGS